MRAKIILVLLALMTSLGFSTNEEASFSFLGGFSTFNQILKKPSGAFDDNTTNDFGLYVGVYGERYLSPSWSLTPGIYLSQKNTKLKSDDAFRKATYLEASSLLRWYFVDNGNWRSYFGVGGGFGILLSVEDSSADGTSAEMKGAFSKNELSFQGGWGIEFPVGAETGLQLGITYSRSLTNFLDPGLSQGDRGTWSGFYSFAALRFKNRVESNNPEERARDYLRWKNSGSSYKSSDSEDFDSTSAE